MAQVMPTRSSPALSRGEIGGDSVAPRTRDELRTLTIDIGGTGIKMLLIDGQGKPLYERARELTPKPSTPDAVLAVTRKMLDAQGNYDRVSVGFPGVVRGVVRTAPNLGTEQWRNFDMQGAIQRATGKPTRVVNDADLQGYGVIRGFGVELVLTLGTGLGTALYVNGHLVPNLELGHHPFGTGETYEELVSDEELKEIGKKKWIKRVMEIIDQLDRIFNYDMLHIGGGNAKHLKDPLPPRTRIFDNVEGLAGGVRLWHDT
jgi:polyphosphate glucokinase